MIFLFISVFGGIVFQGGCIYYSIKFKKPFMYFEIKKEQMMGIGSQGR